MNTHLSKNAPDFKMPNLNITLALVNNLLLTNVNANTSNQYNYIIQNSKYLSFDNIMNNPFFINSSDATTHIRHYLENVGSHYTIISKFDNIVMYNNIKYCNIYYNRNDKQCILDTYTLDTSNLDTVSQDNIYTYKTISYIITIINAIDIIYNYLKHTIPITIPIPINIPIINNNTNNNTSNNTNNYVVFIT